MLTSCVSAAKLKRSVSLNEVEKLIYTATNKNEMAQRFGKPSDTRIQPDMEIWYYYDPESGLERFALQFDKSERLINVLWMPWQDEPEYHLKNAIARYPASTFKVSKVREIYHSINTETTYTDNLSMLIWHDDGRKEVRVIGWFLPEEKSGGRERN